MGGRGNKSSAKHPDLGWRYPLTNVSSTTYLQGGDCASGSPSRASRLTPPLHTPPYCKTKHWCNGIQTVQRLARSNTQALGKSTCQPSDQSLGGGVGGSLPLQQTVQRLARSNTQALDESTCRPSDQSLGEGAGGCLPMQQTSPSNTHSVFDLASLTKPLVTLPLLAAEHLAGKVTYQTRLQDWLPKDTSLPRSLLSYSIAELICHRTRLPAWRNFWLSVLPDDTLSTVDIAKRWQRFADDTAPVGYSDLNYILLGLCLMEVKQCSLESLFNSFLQAGNYRATEHFGFHPDSASAIPSAYCHLRQRLLQGEVHDENCAAFGGVSGHAGLFAAGDDLVSYLHWLFRSPVGEHLLRKNIYLQQHSDDDWLFGLRRGNCKSAATFAAGSAIGHLGFTGCAFWLVPSSGAYAVFLTNRTIAGRVNPEFYRVRRQVFALLWEILQTHCR